MLRTRIATSLLILVAGSVAAAATLPALFTQDYPQPTKHHEMLLTGVGVWEGTLTTYGMGDTAPIPATEVVEAVGGFWTQARFECEFMGMPYVGTGCLGYDMEGEKYVGTWIDGMGSYLAIMEGERNADGALVLRWTAPDPTGAMVPHWSVTVEEEDTRTSTFYMGEGEGVKSMVIEMKRKK